MSYALRSNERNTSQGNGNYIANTLKSQRGKAGGGIGPEETLIAAPLSHGSNPNSNAAGRRREDAENLVAYPISGDALRGEGTAKTPSPDAEGRIRLRDPGFAIGDDGDPAFTLSATSPGAVATASVRRLTPTECERLQHLPDNWTQLGNTPDSRRYAALGDAVTASVAEWIGRRLVAAGVSGAD